MESTELLKKLTEVSAVSGNESEIKKLLFDELKDIGEVSVDLVNNIYCTFGSGYHFLLDAHTDEIGFVVTAITDDGFIKLGKSGGIDCRMLLGYEVVVHGKKDINGVISTLPPHLQKAGEEKKVPSVDEISVDIGMKKEDTEKIISLGDKVTFKKSFNKLIGNRVSANCLDDRSGVLAIILAIKKIKEENLPVKITALFSSQEEVGTRGAKVAAFGKEVDEAISVDVSFGMSPTCKKEDCGELGLGGMIGVSPILSKEIYTSLKEVAIKENIPYQMEIMSGTTGTNADVISITESGIKCGLVSIPLRYMHTPVEVIDMNDVENTANLIAKYIKSKAGVINA